MAIIYVRKVCQQYNCRMLGRTITPHEADRIELKNFHQSMLRIIV